MRNKCIFSLQKEKCHAYVNIMKRQFILHEDEEINIHLLNKHSEKL